jgi:hypothetical protein
MTRPKSGSPVVERHRMDGYNGAEIGPGITDQIIPDPKNQEMDILLTACKGLEDLFFDRNGLG